MSLASTGHKGAMVVDILDEAPTLTAALERRQAWLRGNPRPRCAYHVIEARDAALWGILRCPALAAYQSGEEVRIPEPEFLTWVLRGALHPDRWDLLRLVEEPVALCTGVQPQLLASTPASRLQDLEWLRQARIGSLRVLEAHHLRASSQGPRDARRLQEFCLAKVRVLLVLAQDAAATRADLLQLLREAVSPDFQFVAAAFLRAVS